MKTIKLNNDIHIDLDKLIESRLLIQANSGGGKSWAIRRIIEQAFGKVQIIVIDPEGEFGNMRAKYDFVYAGKGGDAPVESRSAALLARRLLELKASAVIDLYELPPQERKHFVRLFLEAMVNAPKELWHDCLVILDEAHIFAPEKSESEALGSVIDLATRGRKRGFCVVLASQRISKLHKDAAAECNNKLIGRTSLDIDRKRAAEELGLTSKEETLALRNLLPGEFMVFGTAIGNDVKRIHIGDIQVKPAKRGVAKDTLPAPSAKVKAILSKLADLPAEAQEEARTVSELKKENSELKRQNTNLLKQPFQKDLSKEEVGKIIAPYLTTLQQKHDKQMFDLQGEYLKQVRNWFKIIDSIGEAMRSYTETKSNIRVEKVDREIPFKPVFKTPIKKDERLEVRSEFQKFPGEMPDSGDLKPMGEGERKVLVAITQQLDGITREHITVQTGYKRSTRDAYIQRLQAKGYVRAALGRIHVTPEGTEALGDYDILPEGQELIEYHLKNLPEGEAKILKILVDENRPIPREYITEMTGYQRSTRDAYIQRLAARQLVTVEPGSIVRASGHLFS